MPVLSTPSPEAVTLTIDMQQDSVGQLISAHARLLCRAIQVAKQTEEVSGYAKVYSL